MTRVIWRGYLSGSQNAYEISIKTCISNDYIQPDYPGEKSGVGGPSDDPSAPPIPGTEHLVTRTIKKVH